MLNEKTQSRVVRMKMEISEGSETKGKAEALGRMSASFGRYLPYVRGKQGDSQKRGDASKRLSSILKLTLAESR